ncbi:MAG: hypothetical protein JWR16_2676 [Nevskia sp.]|nr:hypothetical protein [Nevskia sp.]
MNEELGLQESFWKRRIVAPIAAQLRQGITPEKLALTVALGTVLSLFPILGTTMLLCALAAFLLKLNQPVIQLLNWICYPLQLALLIPFYRAGEWLGAPHLSLSIPQLVERFQAGAGQFVRDFGLIALGAVGIWCLLAPPFAAALYLILRTPLRTLAARTARARKTGATGS